MMRTGSMRHAESRERGKSAFASLRAPGEIREEMPPRRHFPTETGAANFTSRDIAIRDVNRASLWRVSIATQWAFPVEKKSALCERIGGSLSIGNALYLA